MPIIIISEGLLKLYFDKNMSITYSIASDQKMSNNIIMNPVIILVCPQLGENIGASARAMKNFGLTDLRIVNPRDGWPNPKADSMSVGALDIIKNAQIYDKLEDAIADIEILFASTGTARDMNKNYVMCHDLAASYPLGSKVGIMFGRENSGLTNKEILYANAILTIGTNDAFSSLNIAHAVAIISYEIFKINISSVSEAKHLIKQINNDQKLCTKAELEYFCNSLFDMLAAKDFFKIDAKYPQMTQNIKNIFTRIDKLSVNELQTLHGIIKQLNR